MGILTNGRWRERNGSAAAGPYFRTMRTGWRVQAQAFVLLLAMLSTVLPRELFHSCTHAHHEVPEAFAHGATVQADTHCPICEAPVPWAEGASTMEAVAPVLQRAELGVGHMPLVHAGVPWSRGARGPPVTISA